MAESLEDLLDKKWHHVGVEDVLDANAKAKCCLLEKALEVLKLMLVGK